MTTDLGLTMSGADPQYEPGPQCKIRSKPNTRPGIIPAKRGHGWCDGCGGEKPMRRGLIDPHPSDLPTFTHCPNVECGEPYPRPSYTNPFYGPCTERSPDALDETTDAPVWLGGVDGGVTVGGVG